MVVKEISQKSRRHLGPFRPAATGDLRNRGIQAIGRELAVILNHALDPVAFGAIDERILQLLSIDAWRILAEQWHYVIGGDHVLHHLLVFQQAYPRRQTFLLRQALRQSPLAFPIPPAPERSPERSSTNRASPHSLPRHIASAEIRRRFPASGHSGPGRDPNFPT